MRGGRSGSGRRWLSPDPVRYRWPPATPCIGRWARRRIPGSLPCTGGCRDGCRPTGCTVAGADAATSWVVCSARYIVTLPGGRHRLGVHLGNRPVWPCSAHTCSREVRASMIRTRAAHPETHDDGDISLGGLPARGGALLLADADPPLRCSGRPARTPARRALRAQVQPEAPDAGPGTPRWQPRSAALTGTPPRGEPPW
jgi:hypothetical protein